MSAALTSDERTFPLHKADGLTLEMESSTAITGIVIGVVISLPLWAAIVAIGEMVLRWLRRQVADAFTSGRRPITHEVNVDGLKWNIAAACSGIEKAGNPIMPEQGECQEFRVWACSLDQAWALVKRSPKRMANCALAMVHSRGGMIHAFSARCNTRNSSLMAASSVGKWPLACTARRSLAFKASIALVV